MRMFTTAILLVLTMLGSARADTVFNDIKNYQWKLPLWTSSPLPVPKGWSIEQTEAKVQGKTGYILRGLPLGAAWSDDWIETGFLAWRFRYGAPTGSTRDTLHLTILKSIVGSGQNLDLRVWEEIDGVRASVHAITGPEGQEEYNLILSHWGDPVQVVSTFTTVEEWDSSGAQAYAGRLLQALSGGDGVAERASELELREQLPPQRKPYAMASETKPVTWFGRTIHVPKDWQVTLRPIDAGLAEGLSIWIKTAPNLDDDDAPQLQYARWSEKKLCRTIGPRGHDSH